jgi:Patatin-like phospholipase
MPTTIDAESRTFADVFSKEIEAINKRRDAVASGQLARDRDTPEEHIGKILEEEKQRPRVVIGDPASDGKRVSKDERGREFPAPDPANNLTGLALSGGGIRSASFCLGVLQGIDALREDHEPQVLDRIDYLSTASGGGYIGTSLVSGLMQAQGRFPFASKLDQAETVEVQHLRDHSKFLAPNGATDYIVGAVAMLRGFLINAIIFLAIILLAAAVTIFLNPTPGDLDWVPGGLGLFGWTGILACIFLASQVLLAILGSPHRWTLRTREKFAKAMLLLPLFVLFVAFIELQAYVIRYLLHLDVSYWSTWFSTSLPKLWTALAAAGGVLAASAGKLSSIARTTIGDTTWTGFIKRLASKAALYVAAAIIPLLLWGLYILFSYWGIQFNATPGHSGVPSWLTSLLNHNPSGGGPARLYFWAGILAALVAVFVKPNAGSLHYYYRDRLSRAFLWQRDELEKAAKAKADNGTLQESLGKWLDERRRQFRNPAEPRVDVDRFTFSSLKKSEEKGGKTEWNDDVRFSPYLIVNTAVNLENSKYLNRRGRNADSFIFTPLFMGSEATGFVRSEAIEAIDKNVNLGTAMAASGAATSANMGDQTIKALTFSLAALNVRLGYWLPNPYRVHDWGLKNRLISRLGPVYYAQEAFGLLNERTRNVYLTDGGHFDNLGLYELLKRRCRLIIVVDAEADPAMTFTSFIRLQRHARIDLGARIDLPWEVLRRTTKKVSDSKWERPIVAEDSQGPHVAVGRIDYGALGRGVLIYIKSSVSGDESDLICGYKRRYPQYPHETTADQFFSEEQFEVYRALGFHAAHEFLKGSDAFGVFPSDRYDHWIEDIRQVLDYINVPKAALNKILTRALAGPTSIEAAAGETAPG